MPGTFSPASEFKGNRKLAIPVCITAHASRTCCDACRDCLPAVAGKTFPAFPAHAHPQFDVFGKRPIAGPFLPPSGLNDLPSLDGSKVFVRYSEPSWMTSSSQKIDLDSPLANGISLKTCLAVSSALRLRMAWHWQVLGPPQAQWPLQLRHNERDGIPTRQPHDCFLNRLFRHRSKKTSKLRVTGVCAGNSPMTGEFPAQRASNAENVTIWWRHHGESAGLYIYNICVRVCERHLWLMANKCRNEVRPVNLIGNNVIWYNIWYVKRAKGFALVNKHVIGL